MSMTKMQKISKVSRLGALAVACVVFFSGCQANNTSTSPTQDPVVSAGSASNVNAVDAHNLTGPVSVPDNAEISPVEHPQTPVLPATVTDKDGTSVTVTDISRIVVLDIYGSIGQSLIGFGLADKVVGRTSSDTSPSLAKATNVTSGGHNLNMEALLALKPTLVLMDTTVGSADTASVLRSSGVPVVVLDPKRNKSLINKQIETIGQALGVPDSAKELIAKTDAQMRETTEYIHQLAEKTKPKLKVTFLYVRGSAGVFFIFGKGYGADDLITDLGAQDVAADAGIEDIKPATSEALLKLNPEVIVVMKKGLQSTGGIDGLLKRPGVGQTVAGLNKRIIDMEDGQILAFGPAYPYTLRALAEAIYTKGAQG